MRVTITGLRDTPGGTCIANWDRVPFWGQGVYLDLLDPAISGSCATTLTSAEQLIGASARLDVYVERNSWGAWVEYGIQIDSVRLSTVTGGQYTRPDSPMVMTIGDGPSDNSSFNIFGQVVHAAQRSQCALEWTPACRRPGRAGRHSAGGT